MTLDELWVEQEISRRAHVDAAQLALHKEALEGRVALVRRVAGVALLALGSALERAGRSLAGARSTREARPSAGAATDMDRSWS